MFEFVQRPSFCSILIKYTSIKFLLVVMYLNYSEVLMLRIISDFSVVLRFSSTFMELGTLMLEESYISSMLRCSCRG